MCLKWLRFLKLRDRLGRPDSAAGLVAACPPLTWDAFQNTGDMMNAMSPRARSSTQMRKGRSARKRQPPFARASGRGLIAWARITEATLALRGAVLLQRHMSTELTLKECVRAGLRETTRRRARSSS
jgi:hypothetical protein